METLKLSEIKEKLNVDTISRKENIYTVRKEYFYRFGKDEDTIVEKILVLFPTAKIIDKGDHFAPFRGGASTANSSHWYVKFSI